MYIERVAAKEVRDRLGESPAVALLGPRQVGKTTLATEIAEQWPSGSIYLDLERPVDRRRLTDADAYLRRQAPRLVILDEVHRMPELFEILRGVIDENRRQGVRAGQFLLLGSASLDLIKMSSESLAGRIAHVDLGGITADEAGAAGVAEDILWVRGGFPDSLLATSDAASLRWREDLVRSYLEREVPMFAPRVPAETLRRLWTMVAHNSGGLLNASRLASGLGVSGPTVDRYLDLLVDLGLVRRLEPWFVNTGKRLTKAPKVHVRDSGLLHALLGLEALDDVLGHPAAGPSFAVENLIAAAGSGFQPHHYRTARGDEVDLVLVRGGRPVIAVEIKRGTAPQIGPGTRRAIADLGVDQAYVVHPEVGREPYLDDGLEIIGLTSLLRRLRS